MIGQLLELRYREHAPAYFGPIVRRALAVPVHDLDALIDESKERGLLSEDDAREVLLADLVIRGRRREDGQEIYVLVEVSYTIYPHDVERAVRRAELLSRVRPTVPAVAGEGILADARSRAERHGAWVVLDGRVAVPEGR
ncbi:MAG: hypothetical protein HYU88_11845 [Chloroflexi bacterium]|nr:hypothetical protein [Chloroflexota bacterium]